MVAAPRESAEEEVYAKPAAVGGRGLDVGQRGREPRVRQEQEKKEDLSFIDKSDTCCMWLIDTLKA